MGIGDWIARKLSGAVEVTTDEGIQEIWKQYAAGGERVLGTVAEAKQMLVALTATGHDVRYVEATLEEACHEPRIDDAGNETRLRVKFDQDTVGDTSQVAIIIPPKHTIGYVIEKGSDGYVLESIELRHASYKLLRKGRLPVGHCELPIIRQESYGPYSVI
jgi:hypothetical protein